MNGAKTLHKLSHSPKRPPPPQNKNERSVLQIVTKMIFERRFRKKNVIFQ